MIDETMRQELRQICGSILFDEPLSRHTSIRIGGPADALAYPRTIEELTSLVGLARQKGLPLFVLGAGTNLLVRDGGIRGVVINLTQGFEQIRMEDVGAGFKPAPTHEVTLDAEAGVGLPRLVDFCVEEGLSGLEPLAGIPGNLGGALVMNAGTSEGEIANAVEGVTFLDGTGRRLTWPKEKIRFGYRESHFPRSAILLSARLRLTRMASELVRGRVGQVRAGRVERQPLNLPNLGSVFKNPPRRFAGRLIEEAGFKDVRVGGARISPKHANFIVNEGGAKAKEVLALIGLIKEKVKERFGVTLETEVKVVGEE